MFAFQAKRRGFESHLPLQEIKLHFILMTKLFKLSLSGFIFAFIIALVIGTRSFNHYCSKVIVGDTGGMAFRWGIKESGWENCILNTPILNQLVFEFGLYIVLFLIHVYLVSQQQEKNIIKNMLQISLIGLLFIVPFYLVGLFFPQILYGFLEGGVSIKHGGLIPIFFSNFFSRQPNVFYFAILSLKILLLFIILQAGPLIMTLLLNKFHLSSGYKPGIKSFLYVFFGSILFELLVLMLLFIGIMEYNRVFYKLNPGPYIGSAPRTPVRYEVDFEKAPQGN